MKGFLKYLLAAQIMCISLNYSAQTWDTLTRLPIPASFKYSSAAHFDNKLFLAFTDLQGTVGKTLYIYEDYEWKPFDEFLQKSPGYTKHITLQAIGDSGIIIGAVKPVAQHFRDEIYYYNGDSLRLLSKYTRLLRKESHFPAFGLNNMFLSYFEENTSTADTNDLYLLKHSALGKDTFIVTHGYNSTFRANSTAGLLYLGPHPQPTQLGDWYQYHDGLSTVTLVHNPDVTMLQGAPFADGFICVTEDLTFGSTDPKRRLVQFTQNNFLFVGKPYHTKIHDLVNYKSKLYFSANRHTSLLGTVCYSYDGNSFDSLSFEDELMQSNTNPYSKIYELSASKDYLYAFGTINFIDSVRPAFGMVRTPILNDLNLPPSALNESYSTNDTTVTLLNITANDTDPNGDYLYPKVISHNHGQIRVRTNENFEYTPEFGFAGTDTIFYKSCDLGGMCASAYAVITITKTSEEPFANDDMRFINENETIAIDVAANDVYGSQGIDIKLVRPPQKGQVVFDQVSTFTYTPDFNEAFLDSFQYEACRSYNWCKMAWARVYINLTNVPPVVENELVFVDNPQITVEPLINDFDPDTDLITYEIIQGPFHPSSFLTNLNSASFRFVTSEMYAFVRDSVLYKVCDPYGSCDSAWAVFWGNRPPVTNTDTAYITEYQTYIYPLANDYDPDNQHLVYDILAGPYAPNSEALYCGPGCLRYNNPDINKFWHDSIIYKATDIRGISTEGKIILINATLGLNEEDLGILNIFPNPTMKELSIKANANLENGLCKIYDAKGKLVHSGHLQGKNGQYKIDVSLFDKSYYIIYITTTDRVYFGNFIKL
jgi:hypothetical protein